MNKNNKRTIRDSVGLPDDNGKIVGLVSEDPHEICENTIGYSRPHKSSSSRPKARGFDFGPSGGATSPNTEVNADGQGIISEIPRKS